MLLVPYWVISWCLLYHHPLLSQSCLDIQTLWHPSTFSLPIITLSSLCVFILIALHFWAFSFSPSLPALCASQLVLFCMCSYLDETRTMSSAKSRSSCKHTCEVPSDAISMPFCCSSHCEVNSKQEKEAWHYTSLFNASGDLKPSCLFSLFQYRTLKIVIHDLHHSYCDRAKYQKPCSEYF